MSLPLVLLPAMMCDARVFSHQIVDLSRKHTIILAPVSQESRIEAIASNLLNRLPARFALLGLSFGGIVAMDILRQAPDRVDRVCLMGCSPLPETPEIAATREPLIVRAQAGKLDDVLAETMKPEYLSTGPSRTTVMSQMLTMGRDLGPEVFVRQSRALQRRRDQQSTLRRCKVPALIVCGEEDSLVPVKRHSFLADLMPDARLEVVEGAGHIPPLEQPDKVNDLLQSWLEQPLVLR